LRDAYPDVQRAGGEVVAIGTGPSMAQPFVEDYRIPYPVLIDADARAAKAATIGRMSFLGMFTPASYPGTIRAWRAGHRIGASGKRVTQLAASFVIGPGPRLYYEHRNRHGADHPPLAEVLAALES
jgi:peroxiredoxin